MAQKPAGNKSKGGAIELRSTVMPKKQDESKNQIASEQELDSILSDDAMDKAMQAASDEDPLL